MKYYDKMGETHNTRMGSFAADVANVIRRKSKRSRPLNTVMYKAEEVIEDLTEYSEDEITAIVSSMMYQLHDPIQSFLKGELNSEIGEKKFLEMVFGILGSEYKKNPVKFFNSYDVIVCKFAGELTNIISVNAKDSPNEEPVG